MFFELETLFNTPGMTIPFDYTMDFSDVKLDRRLPFQDGVRVHGVFRNRADVVAVDAAADFLLTLDCDRCAREFARSYSVPVRHVLVRELNDESNDELICLDSYRMDLDALVSDDIFLSLPSKFLCSDDCAGLCLYCGKNLNDGPCSCHKPVDPRLESLMQLLDNS